MEDRYLFKAKRADNGEWVTGYYTKSIVNGSVFGYIRESIFGTDIKIMLNTLCQYTGLKDKNVNLIWENDIVDFLGHKGIVKYDCGSFGIAYKECIDWEEIESNICHVTGCDNALYACENDNFISLWEIYWNFNDEDNSVNTVEVIGNIFDNPELLESED